MRTLSVNIPDYLDIDQAELTLLIASKLYEQGRLSLGQAAEFVGMTKRDFIEVLGRFDVSVFNFAPSELSQDVANA